ncbi:hypothetical protein [Denitromonas iodatirespirans]|uniref:Uncharacterized protein n=1 Tax=Denitromonas iodatirespirans TaxID=2795389 RepID=A0A944HDY8_DENI1|nr:hypothetical protein [Denitromonas iodatirespirans]MBT0964222.1 hypothetical protein [Denitromonas iodatirespirans]
MKYGLYSSSMVCVECRARGQVLALRAPVHYLAFSILDIVRFELYRRNVVSLTLCQGGAADVWSPDDSGAMSTSAEAAW